MHESQATTALPPEFFPDAPAPIAGRATPAYDPPYAAARVRESGLGYASCAVCGTTLLYTVACAAGVLNSVSWGALGWLVAGLVGNWIGCGVAFFLGLGGVVQARHGRRWAIHGMWLSVAVAVVPLVVWAALAPK